MWYFVLMLENKVVSRGCVVVCLVWDVDYCSVLFRMDMLNCVRLILVLLSCVFGISLILLVHTGLDVAKLVEVGYKVSWYRR